MLSPRDLYNYQIRAIDHILDHPFAMIWQSMGGGKTVATLTGGYMLLDRWEVRGILVVAPLPVCQLVWRREAAKWSHLQGLTFSAVYGTAEEREMGLQRPADIYLVNYDNLGWLVGKIDQLFLKRKRNPPFDMLVLDEITRVKNAQAKRSKALYKLLKLFKRRVGLTGEPSPNGYPDLYGQYKVIDGGERLGTTLTSYRERFLRPHGYMQYQWSATRSGRKKIHARISDITMEMSADDYLDLPEVRYNTIRVELPPKARGIYDTMEKEFFAELDSGATLEVMSEASKLVKLLQIASGAAYLTVGGPWEKIHAVKLEALESVLEESAGSPVLVGYTFVHEAKRISERWPEKPVSGASFLSAQLSEREKAEILGRWHAGHIPLLCGHPASMGHGLNLTETEDDEVACRTVAWVSLPWSLELYKQLNARVTGGHRRKRGAIVHHIIAADTVDEVVYTTLQQKHQTQEGLKKAISDYREKRRL